MRMLVMAHLNGRTDLLARAGEAAVADGADMVLFAGSVIGDGSDGGRAWSQAYSALEQLGIPSYSIPGPADVPERRYLSAALAHESVGKWASLVHGAYQLAPRAQYAVVGFGGEITDDARETRGTLRYPGWELAARLDLLRRLEHKKLPFLLFHTPPADAKQVDLDEDGAHAGSMAVREAINTWRPKVAVCAGARPAHEIVGDSLVVSPGRLDEGHYALVDVRHRTVQAERLPSAAPA